MVLFGACLYGCGPRFVLGGDGSRLPVPGRPDTPRTHIGSTKAWSWRSGLRQAAVGSHKGGEGLPCWRHPGGGHRGARRGIRRVRRTPHLRGRPRGELVPGWEPTWHLSEPRCPPSVQTKPTEAMGHPDNRFPVWTGEFQGLLLRASAPIAGSCAYWGCTAGTRRLSRECTAATSTNADATLSGSNEHPRILHKIPAVCGGHAMAATLALRHHRPRRHLTPPSQPTLACGR